MAALPPTIRSLNCPLLEIVPATLTITAPEAGMSTHFLWSCGLATPMLFRCASQVGTSHREITMMLALGPSTGILAPSASRAVGHCAHQFALVCGVMRLVTFPGTTSCQLPPRQGNSWEVGGMWYNLRAEVCVSLSKKRWAGKTLVSLCRASHSAVQKPPNIILTPSLKTNCIFLMREVYLHEVAQS